MNKSKKTLQEELKKAKKEVEKAESGYIVGTIGVIAFIILAVFRGFKGVTTFTKTLPPTLVETPEVMMMDASYKINTPVFKIMPDGSLDIKTLKGIYARENGIRYYLEDCGMFPSETCSDGNGCITKHTYQCKDGEEVTMIGNTEEELRAIICNTD